MLIFIIMKNKLYPEIVVGILIQNSKREIVLFKSRKWKDKWVTIGGHVEYGETLRGGGNKRG
jgi:8-oxo-dGTP pyrophosphatase MutT (NUDIX family)